MLENITRREKLKGTDPPATDANRHTLTISPEIACSLVIIITHLLLLESMAAPRTVWYKVVKFGTLIKDSPVFNFTKFHLSHCSTLAPPTGQSWTCVYTRNF